MANTSITDQVLEGLIADYFRACSGLDHQRLRALFEPAIVHYRPSGTLEGPDAFLAHIDKDVRSTGAAWHPDTITASARLACGFAEWTSVKPTAQRVLRGCSRFNFSPSARILEVRVYFSGLPDLAARVNELPGFPYRARSWTTL